MLRRVFMALLAVVAIGGLAQTANAQYMYLDSNANGVHDAGDKLNANGTPTTVDLYVQTNLNRDGTTATCDTGTQLLTINQYQINLLAVGGLVTYSGFVNQQASMPTAFGELNPDGVRYKNGFGGGTQNPAGTYRLCTLTITGVSSSPHIDIVDLVNGSTDFTGFGTSCLGRGFDNVYRLDGPNVLPATGDVGDFVDWDGIAAAGGGNTAPVVTNPGNKTVNELSPLTFTVTATDTDVPSQTITWSLTLGTPAATGATIAPATGAFSWTPSEAQGPGVYPVTVTATDNGTPVMSGTAAFTITVNEVNSAPVVTNPGNRTVAELANLAFTVTATDSDIPANTITWSLTLGTPAATGATIGAGGAFSWTPSEAQGPGVYPVTIVATDNGSPMLSGSAGITITVTEVNSAPILAAIGNKSGSVGTPVTFTATATDTDIPANTLTFSLTLGTPPATGATINGSTGAFSWTPSATGNYPVTITVTDNGSPALNDFEGIVIGVTANPPVLAAIGNRTVNELVALTFTATATAGTPPYTFSLDAGAPAGATITAAGAFSWTPTEAQGPGVYPITVRVTDNVAQTDFETIQVTVSDVNTAPVVTNPGNRTTAELANLAFTVTATDTDIPANTITWSLTLGTPAATGATIGAGGAFSWTPTEAQGPGVYPVTIVATDNGSPVLSGSAAITITVTEVNSAPVVTNPGNRTTAELANLAFTVTATDTDVPANTITWSLTLGTPAATGATIGAGGAFSWTPTEAQGPGVYPVTIVATDNGSPILSGSAAITITVTEVNSAPVVTNPGNRTTAELANLAFTVTATDTDIPANTITWSLTLGTPAATGATIGAGGAFSWTPTEAQGPGTYPVTIVATDNGSPVLSGSAAITITVTEVNSAPVLTSIGNKTGSVGTPVTFTATATDTDIPANTLTFSLTLGTPPATGATINGSTGAFSWTPSASGNYPVTITVTDNGSPVLNDFEGIVIGVGCSNNPPVLAAIGNKAVNELATLAFTATATDPDAGQTLTFSLDAGNPAGSTINASTGAFSWTPTEAQGGTGSPFPITVRVTDSGGGCPTASDFETIQVTVNEVNTAPVVTNPGNRTTAELANLAFTVTATDTDIPANTITWSLTLGTPAATGATIGAGGAFSWTPTEAQGPGVYPVTIVATDNGSPVLSGSAAITITVTEVNSAPVLAAIGNQSGSVGTPVTFTATATDTDIPANTLTFSLTLGTPPATGATINGSTGAFSWTPSASGNYPVTITVTDNGSPVLNDFEGIVISVGANPPVLAAIGNRTVNELVALTFTATATAGTPPYTFSLDAGAPAGATITAAGAFSWTPTEAQGPGVYPITVRVTDNAAQTDFETIQVTVSDVNTAPVVTNPGNRTTAELANLAFTVTATDTDIPANTITWSLTLGTPAATGATIGAGGAFSWTPTEAQGPGVYPVTIVATDNGSPVLSGSAAITITVTEVNSAPVLAAIGNKTGSVGAPVTFTATATDTDIPANTLTFSLTLGTPPATGATINGSTGAFSWTPSASGNYPVTITVTDNGSPVLNDLEGIVISVGANPPVLAAIGNRTVNELVALTFTATATAGTPPYTFSLDAGAPAGAAITAAGAFSWTPTEAQGPGVYPITVRVTDNAAQSDFETIQVMVNEVNTAPVVTNPGNRTVAELANLAFTVTATDSDIPANTITWSLTLGTPAATGATIGAGGAFSWTPTEAQGPGVYPVTIVATDNGSPIMNGSAAITITVTEVNSAPVLAAIGNKTGTVGTPVTFTATATDTDIPANTLTFSLDAGAPAGATINGSTGAFSWTPTASGTFPVTVRVTDNGSPALSDFEAISIVVGGGNEPPVLAAIGNKTVDELTTLAFTATATDPNSGDVLTFSLDAGSPPGATINGSTGAFSWTPTEAQGPGVYPITVRVTDSGGLSDFETIQVTVNEVNGPPMANADGPYEGSVNANVTFDGTGSSDPDGNPLTYMWDFGDGATLNNGPTPAHAYSAEGVYNVTLTVCDNGTPQLCDEDVTTVTIRSEVPVRIILKNNGSTVDARKGKGHFKLAIEETEFPYTGILANTLRLSTDYPNAGTVSECAAEIKSGTGTIGDLDLNGVPDYFISFLASCVKNLFNHTPNNTTVNLIVTGEFQTSTGTLPLRGVKSVTVRTSGGGAAPIMASAYPNPFNPETAISYTVKNAGPVTLRIFSIDGRLIRTLKQGEGTEEGTHEVTWNGTDNLGHHVPSGIYFVKTSQKTATGEESSILKLALTK